MRQLNEEVLYRGEIHRIVALDPDCSAGQVYQLEKPNGNTAWATKEAVADAAVELIICPEGCYISITGFSYEFIPFAHL